MHKEIEYLDGVGKHLSGVLGLYEDAGWTEYLKDAEGLKAGIAVSLRSIVAIEAGLVVGFARAVGDGKTIVVIQDLIVREGYRRLGIGRRLVELSLAGYAGVRQRILLCDRELEGYYRKLGFRNGQELGCVLMMGEPCCS